MDLKQTKERLKTDLPALFLAIQKKETPLRAKCFAALAVAYALSPIDLAPDFIPVLGYLDDLMILPVLAALAVKSIPTSVMDQCREESVNLWQEGKPKNWLCALPILAVWGVLLLFLAKLLLDR